MKLYNTLGKRLMKFESIKSGEAGLYTCGPTAYFYAHIGNMRTNITNDVLKRALRHYGLRVRHVMNITDVGHNVGDEEAGEDKIRVRAKAEHKTVYDIIGFYTDAFMQDLMRLNIIMPDVVAKASDHIEPMLRLIDTLDKKGFLYKAANGIYFDTSKSRNYGELIGVSFKQMLKEQRAGARVERPGDLRNITDFVVWRFAKEGEKDLVWDTKYGRGFPGWHIECSAMSMMYLGETLDLHAGGMDLIPVHHTNEIAQSEAATGKKFVNYWVHGALLTVNGQKMSKSLMNIYAIEDLIAKGFKPLSYRYMALNTHYRSMMNFSFDSLKEAEAALGTIYMFVSRISNIDRKGDASKEFVGRMQGLQKQFFDSVYDDLDMPIAVARMHDLVGLVNKRNSDGSLTKKEAKIAIDIMLDFDSVLGLDLEEHLMTKITKEERQLILDREEARLSRDFEKADRIRKTLREKHGIVVEDTSEGSLWYRAA